MPVVYPVSPVILTVIFPPKVSSDVLLPRAMRSLVTPDEISKLRLEELARESELLLERL